MIEITAETLNRMASENKIIVWGAGETLDNIIFDFSEYNFEKKILYIVDSNPKKWNTYKKYLDTNIEIVAPDRLYEIIDIDTKLLIASIHYNDILRQIEEMGLGIECYKFPRLKYDFQLEIKHNKKNEPICDNLIVFQSSLDYSDNARVLFDYMIENHLNKKYKLVWAVRDVDEFSWMKSIENVDVYCVLFSKINDRDTVREDTEKYFKYLFTARIFFVSHSLEWLRDRKPEQTVFNLWHGNGYKNSKIGKNHKDSFEYTCVTGPLYKKYQSKFFCCDEKKAVVTGHPKTDLFFTCNVEKIKNMLDMNGYSKIIVWMPTFRGATLTRLNENTIECETGIPIARTFKELKILNERLASHNMLLIIKLHQYQKTEDYTHNLYSNIRVWDSDVISSRDIQPNELLACADALISDYSSAATDFLSVDRIMGFAIDDYEEYIKGRLFIFDPLEDYLPGYILRNMDDLMGFIKDVYDDNDKMQEKRRKLLPQMMAYRDGNSCRRIVKFMKLEEV